MKKLKLIALCIVTTFIIGCKKYPENRLWFKKPEKVFKEGRLTSYTVDNVDSIPLLNSTWGYDLTAENFKLTKADKSPHYNLTGAFLGEMEFANDNKRVEFTPRSKLNTFPPTYYPFSSSPLWDMIKCTNKGVLKLQRTINGKTYKLQFN